MPKEVLESAEKTLSALEKGQEAGIGKVKKADFGKITKPYYTSEGKVESDGTLQLTLFQLDDPTLSSLRDTLNKADLNNMTPLQAFDLLRDMKKELGLN
jgi:DNA mismatch repair protein MutS